MAVTSQSGYRVVAGSSFVATLPVPPNVTAALGARVEAPLTRAIVTAWVLATIDQSGTATVLLESPLDVGFYNLVWMTGDSSPHQFEAFVPIEAVASIVDVLPEVDWPDVDPAAVRPEVADVARLERSRTIDATTNTEVGTFTAGTRPTAAEVEDLIDQGVDDVLAELREQFDPRHYQRVKRSITFYVAMMIEGSYYKEQSPQSGAVLPWQDEYREALQKIQDRIEQDIVLNNRLGMMEPRQSEPRFLA